MLTENGEWCDFHDLRIGRGKPEAVAELRLQGNIAIHFSFTYKPLFGIICLALDALLRKLVLSKIFALEYIALSSSTF